MKKLIVEMTEIVKYKRDAVFEVPEGMSYKEINEHVNDCEFRSYIVDDFLKEMGKLGFRLMRDIDVNDYSSPSDMNIEIDNYHEIEVNEE